MAKGTAGKNYWALLLMILAGVVLGGFIGQLSAGVPALRWLNYGQTFGLSNPLVLDLGILVLTFGLTIKITIAGIIGTGHLSHTGTSGQKISFQYSRVPNRFTATNVHNANTIVIAILPVTLAPPGKIGISPMMLLMKMKKKTVSRYGANRL